MRLAWLVLLASCSCQPRVAVVDTICDPISGFHCRGIEGVWIGAACEF